jgi:hypothetical protein
MAEIDPYTAWEDIARHETAIATVLLFAERSGAVRVAALLDTGAGSEGTLVEAEKGGPVIVTAGGEAYEIPLSALAHVPPRPLDPPRPVPSSAWRFDPQLGEVSAPIGAVAMLGLGVLELARVLGGRTVATADFAMADGEPVTIAARLGEPLLLAVGDEQFELPVPYSIRD